MDKKSSVITVGTNQDKDLELFELSYIQSKDGVSLFKDQFNHIWLGKADNETPMYGRYIPEDKRDDRSTSPVQSKESLDVRYILADFHKSKESAQELVVAEPSPHNVKRLNLEENGIHKLEKSLLEKLFIEVVYVDAKSVDGVLLEDAQINATNYLLSMALLSKEDSLPGLLARKYDKQIATIFYYVINKRFATCTSQLRSIQITKLVTDFIKNSKRGIEQTLKNPDSDIIEAFTWSAIHSFDPVDNYMPRNIIKEIHRSDAAIEFCNMNAAPVEGSVKSIASKYNISIAEVRRMKKENVLSDFITKMENKQ